MSKIIKKELRLKSGKSLDVNVEQYSSAAELVKDCDNRQAHQYEDMKTKDINEWHGVKNYAEALDLLATGYQPTVEKLQTALKANRTGVQRRIQFENNVHGFAPIVPLALKGVPNSMMNMTMKPIKCKVIDVYYDICVAARIEPEEIIQAGQKVLGAIIDLEKQGYRFNLYALQAYSDTAGADVLCVKVKSADKPLDLKRISFPLTHTAFFRVIGFDWQAKSPVAKYRGFGRGQSLYYNTTKSERAEITKTMFGENAVYISCSEIVESKDESRDNYIEEVFKNGSNKR